MQPTLLTEKWKREEEEERGNDLTYNRRQLSAVLGCDWGVGGASRLCTSTDRNQVDHALLWPGAVCEREHLPPGTLLVRNLIFSQLQPNQSERIIYFKGAGTGGWEVERKQDAD